MNRQKAKALTDSTFIRFLLVGGLNTAIGMVVMLMLYNLAGWGYWTSSAVAYIIGSIVSFILNRCFTFQNKEAVSRTLPRFVINIAICYFLAYSVAKPVMHMILENLFAISSIKLIENIAMIFGMALFTIINYLGQRYFAFRPGKTG